MAGNFGLGPPATPLNVSGLRNITSQGLGPLLVVPSDPIWGGSIWGGILCNLW